MKLVLPAGVSSVSHDGITLEIVDSMIDVTGEAFDVFHVAHGFKTEDEVADEDAAAGKAAAIAAAVVSASKKK
jgi:hypothetical protein